MFFDKDSFSIIIEYLDVYEYNNMCKLFGIQANFFKFFAQSNRKINAELTMDDYINKYKGCIEDPCIELLTFMHLYTECKATQKTHFLELCKEGNLEILKILCEDFGFKNVAGGFRGMIREMLIFSVTYNHINIIDYLQNKFNLKKLYFNEFLYTASESGNTELVKYLWKLREIQRNTINVHRTLIIGEEKTDTQCLEVACKYGHLGIVKFFYDNGVKITEDAIFLAISYKKVHIINYFNASCNLGIDLKLLRISVVLGEDIRKHNLAKKMSRNFMIINQNEEKIMNKVIKN